MFAPRYIAAFLLKSQYKVDDLWFLLCIALLPELFDTFTTESIIVRLVFHALLYFLGTWLTNIAPNRKHEQVKFVFDANLRRWTQSKVTGPRFWPLRVNSYFSTPGFWRLVSGIIMGHLVFSLLHDLVFAFCHWAIFEKVQFFMTYIVWLSFELGQLIFGLHLIYATCLKRHHQLTRIRTALGIAVFCILLLLDYNGVFSVYSKNHSWTTFLALSIHALVILAFFKGVDRDLLEKVPLN